MKYVLVSEDDYDSLPEEPDLKWVELEEIARAKQIQIEGRFSEDGAYEALRLQYMAVVSAAAEELGIDGIYFDGSIRDVQDSYYAFVRDVQSASTRIRLRHSGRKNRDTVAISENGRDIIIHQTKKLIHIVEESDLAEKEKEKYIGYARNIIEEISRPRVRISSSAKLIGSIAAGIALGTSAIADAPEAISIIIGVLGIEKNVEDNRLELPSYHEVLLALPPPTQDEG